LSAADVRENLALAEKVVAAAIGKTTPIFAACLILICKSGGLGMKINGKITR